MSEINDGKSETDITELIEDVKDLLAIELFRQTEDYSNWEDVKKRLREKGIID